MKAHTPSLHDVSHIRAANLKRLYEPTSVAVLGASEDRKKVGSRPVALLQKYGFGGRIYPINPRRPTIGDLPAFASLADLPEVPDVVVFAVPARDVPAAIRDCAERGVGAAVVYTSGFGEVGPEGKAVEEELRDISARTGMIVCGPNCQGTANFHNGAVLNFTSALMGERLQPGNIGLVTQSGLVGGLIITECLKRGLGVGYITSTGNEAGMSLSDAIMRMAHDPRVRVISGYVEQIRDLPRFGEAVEAARLGGKPVVLLKVGRSPDAAKAAASHTGSLAGAAELYDAAFAAMGVIAVDSFEELLDITMAFSSVRVLPRGRRVGILTNSGGLGVFSADEVFRQRLEMASFAPETVAGISARLFDFGSPANPVDISTQAFTDIDSVGSHLEKVFADPEVDIVSATFGLQFLNAAPLAEHFIRLERTFDKPLLISWVCSDEAAAKRLQEAGLPTFSDPARALRAASRLADFAARRADAPGRGSDCSCPEAVMRLVSKTSAHLGEAELLPVLAEAGLPIPAMRRAASSEGVAAAFREIGARRVVVKIDSPDIAHKSDVGGVRLSLDTPEAAGAASREMLASVRERAPEARIDGFIVAEMVEGGVEAFIGVKRDPSLGPFVAVGLGGIFIEIFKDVVLRPAPVSVEAAEAMIRELEAFPLLEGARGRPPCDVRALASAVATISRIAAEWPSLVELDLNPVLVREAGKGVVVLDALARADGA